MGNINQDYFFSYPVTGNFHTNPTPKGHSLCVVDEVNLETFNELLKLNDSSKSEHSDLFRIAACVLREFSYKTCGRYVGFVNQLFDDSFVLRVQIPKGGWENPNDYEMHYFHLRKNEIAILYKKWLEVKPVFC